MAKGVREASLICAAVGVVSLLAYCAYSRPSYFTNQSYLKGLIGFELLLASVWLYRKVFFALVLVSFVFAGTNLPVGAAWGMARWPVLGVGAAVGIVIVVREHGYRFGVFHALALLASLTALASSTVSVHPSVVLLKGLSLLLLFAYGSTGVRVAATYSTERFFSGLVLGSEILFGLLTVFYLAGIDALGNPNSLGGAASIAGVPILLWATLITPPSRLRHVRLLLYCLCMFLTFASRARAGIAAALMTSALLCLVFRRYKAMMQGAVVILICVAIAGLFWPQVLPSMTSEIVYKGGEDSRGILASRVSPWSAALDNIKQHLFFGSGLGTTVQGNEPPTETGIFSSSSNVTAENGSSYLALLAGVGILGIIPFVLMFLMVFRGVVRTMSWARITGSIAHPAVPLALIIVSGIIHGAFEDWMFAPGSYLCVFFWCAVFLFNDFAPSAPALLTAWRFRPQGSNGTTEASGRPWPYGLPTHYSQR